MSGGTYYYQNVLVSYLMIVESLTEIAKKLSTEDKSLSLGVFLASRRIPFEKDPGSRPIGAGKVLRRVFFWKIYSINSA